jgi:hypothetical protein
MNSFTTLFEISEGVNGIRTEFLVRIIIGVAVLVFGIAGIVARRKTGGSSPKKWYGPIFITGWGVVWLGFHLPLYLAEKASTDSLLDVYRNKRFEIVEGIVKVRHEQPASGHDKGDIIAIGDKEFEINFFMTSPSYTATISHGGALREGVYARLSCYEGKILKVEVQEKPIRPTDPTRGTGP